MEAQRVAVARPVGTGRGSVPIRTTVPRIHDVHPIAEAGAHAEIVADPDHEVPRYRAAALHQVDDLRLDGDIERRRRLVGDQQARVARTARWRS
jgi:hypothetical protein